MSRELEAYAAAFEAIALGPAQERAGLTVRTDRKYLLPPGRLERLVDALARDHVAVEVTGGRLCAYDSVYFDTPDLLSFRQHVQGRRRRFKCRTRLYCDGTCFFEVKLRSGRGETLKRRLELPQRLHGSLTPPSRRFLAEELGRAYGQEAPHELVPSLTTSFTRLTLVARDARERVTCDVGLSFHGDGGSFAIVPGHVLVETKSALGNGSADAVLRRLGARPVAPCSKYCLGIALTRDGVRDNPFRRLLRRHFEPSPSPALLEAAS